MDKYNMEFVELRNLFDQQRKLVDKIEAYVMGKLIDSAERRDRAIDRDLKSLTTLWNMQNGHGSEKTKREDTP